MEVAVRAWAVPDYARHRKGGGGRFEDLGPSAWTLTFDTETTRDTTQRLRIGTFQLRRHDRLREAGVFYDPDVLSVAEIETVENTAAARGWTAMPAAEFIETILLRTAWDRRGLIVGHNLPFDIARVAVDCRPVQSRDPSMRGGFTFKLSPDEKKSHIQVKRANPGAAFIRLTIPAGVNPELRNRDRGGKAKNHHGYYLDTGTLAAGLLGGRMKLGRLAEVLETDTQKSDAEHGQAITPGYLDYAMTDVQVTFECLRKLLERYEHYELPKEPWQIYSQASIGKAHLEKMGLTPPRQRGAGFDDWVTAAIMETYYGGRTECAIRRTAVPGVYVDFASQYPTVFVLQRLWSYMTAEHISWQEEPPDEAQALLDQVSVHDVLTPELWPKLSRIVLVEPDGDRLPTRARFGRSHRVDVDATKQAMNVGVSIRTGGPGQWWTLADCIASKLHTGKSPKIARVLRFTADGVQGGLAPIEIAGEPDFRIDPIEDDFVKRLVELRADVRQRKTTADRRGETALATRLEAIQQAMKTTANGVCYGSPIEMNVIEHRKKVWVTVHRPDGTSYRTRVQRTEKPGTWFNPLVATLVASAGRLLLAAGMRLIDDAGGRYALCDTDSLFVVATERGGSLPSLDGALPALTHADVAVLIERFAGLNPYRPDLVPGSVLEVEKENFDPDTGDQREIWCHSIASKRYALFVYDQSGNPSIIQRGDKRHRSEHGLGHLLPPTETSSEDEGPDWLDDWWDHLLHTELDIDHPAPDWFSQPAIARLTVTSPRDLAAFKAHNADKPYPEQLKPWGFVAMAHPTPQERARKDGPRSLVAAYERDPDKQLDQTWFDRGDPSIHAGLIRTTDQETVLDESYAVLSYGDYFKGYRRHPELKALAMDGRPCHTWTRGVLSPRHVRAVAVIRIGKESNRLSEERLPADDESEAVIEYQPAACRGCNRRVNGRRKWCSEACRKRTARRRTGNQRYKER
jgi:hypothetical protein